MARRRARTDDNQAAIVAALRQLGCEVADLSGVGDGLPDLLVMDQRKRLRLFEIKTATGTLRPKQQAFQAKGWPVQIVRSVDQAVAVVLGQPERAEERA
jgi:hypothetical protein